MTSLWPSTRLLCAIYYGYNYKFVEKNCCRSGVSAMHDIMAIEQCGIGNNSHNDDKII